MSNTSNYQYCPVTAPDISGSGWGNYAHANQQHSFHAAMADEDLSYAESMAGYAAAGSMSASPEDNSPYLDSSCMNTPFTPPLDLTRFQNLCLSSPNTKARSFLESDQPKDVLLGVYMEYGASPDFVSIESATPSHPKTVDAYEYNLFGVPLFGPLTSGEQNTLRTYPSTASPMQDPVEHNPFDDFFHHESTGSFRIPPFEPEFRWPLNSGNTNTELEDVLEAPSALPTVSKRNMRSYQCDICLVTFSRRYNMNTHRRTHDVRRKKRFCCVHCTWGFDRKHDLTRHISTVHNRERAHRCTICLSAFTRKNGLTRHLLRRHNIQMHI